MIVLKNKEYVQSLLFIRTTGYIKKEIKMKKSILVIAILFVE